MSFSSVLSFVKGLESESEKDWVVPALWDIPTPRHGPDPWVGTTPTASHDRQRPRKRFGYTSNCVLSMLDVVTTFIDGPCCYLLQTFGVIHCILMQGNNHILSSVHNTTNNLFSFI